MFSDKASASTSNPLLSDSDRSDYVISPDSHHMTLSGMILRAILLLLTLSVASVIASIWFTAWERVHHGHVAYLFVSRVFTVTFVGAIVLVMVTKWKKHLSYFTAPLFSIVEGVALGIASAAGNIRYPGVVMQTIGLTIAMSTFLLVAYGFGSLTFGASFTRKLSVAVCGIIAYFAGSLLLAIAGVSHIMIFTTGIRGAFVSVAVIAIPGTLLIRTCDAAVQRVGESKPKYMEWYLALGIVVSIVWIYYEMLEMLAMARRSA